MHFVEKLMKQFEKSSWKLIFLFQFLERHACFQENVVKNRLNICVKVLSEKIRNESSDVFEPWLKLMCFSIDWSFFVLVENKKHDEDGHVKCKRSCVGKNTDNLRHNSLIIFHNYSPGNPI